jgi:outer membrane protein
MKHLLLAMTLVLSGTAFAQQSKVVYVDMQKAVQTTKAGGKAKKELETEFNAKKKKLQSQEEKLKKMQEDLEKKAMVLSDEVRGKKQQEFQEEMMSYQKLVAQSQQEIQKREQDLTKPILDKMSKIIEQISKEKGYDMVLEKQANNVLWAKKEADITDDVISAFEKAK